MSIKKIVSIFALVSFLINLSNPKIINAQVKKIENPEEKNKFQKILDKEAGFLIEENSIKVLKTIKENYPKKETSQSQKEIYILATAYTSSVFECDSSPFITASGTHVHFGTVAANFLPFGTKIKIPEYFGDKIFIVEDRMANWNKIDIWMPNYKEAINFGKRNVKIIILD